MGGGGGGGEGASLGVDASQGFSIHVHYIIFE